MALDSPPPTRNAFFVAGGTVPPGAPSYVERSADRELVEALLNGEYSYVLNSRQMGKSSLAVRTIAKLKEAGVRTAFIDLTRLGGATVTPEQWYTGLLMEVGRALGLRTEAARFIQNRAGIGPANRFQAFLGEIITEKMSEPVVVMIDEIDATRSLPFSTDEFFAGIRQLHNARASDPALRRLTFCLLGAALPSDLIRDARLTPFNVGRRIELLNFTETEAEPFADALGDDGGAKLKRVLYWTGGHPFLTQSLCAALATQPEASVDGLVRARYLDARARETDSNLADIGNRLLGRGDPSVGDDARADVLSLYARMLKGGIKDDESNPAAARIKMSGAARLEGGRLLPRNEIYRRVFGPEWIAENMPGQEVRRQKRAYRLGAFRTALGAGAILAVIATLLVLAVLNAQRANRAETLARQQRDEARYEAYVASIRSLPLSLELNNLHEIGRVVDSQKDFAGKGWEWGYWHRLANRALVSAKMDEYDFASPAITQNGHYAVLAAKSGDALGVFDLEKGLLVRRIPLSVPSTERYEIHFFDRDRKLALMTGKAYLTLDFVSGRELLNRKTGGIAMYASSFLDDTHVLGFLRSGLYSIDMETGAVKLIRPPDGRYRMSCIVSPDRKLACWLENEPGSELATPILVDTATWKPVGRAQPAISWFTPRWSPDSRTVAWPLENGGTALFAAPSGKELWSQKVTDGFILSVEFSPDGTRLLAAGTERVARLWDISGPKPRHVDDYLDANWATFLPEKGRLATFSFELRTYDMDEEPKVPSPEPGHHWFWTTLTSQGQFVGWRGEEMDRLDLLRPTQPRQSYPFRTGPVRFDSSGRTLCSRIDRTDRFRISDIDTGKTRTTLEVPTVRTGFVYDRTRDGHYALVHHTIVELPSGKPVSKLITGGPATQARFSPDGRLLIVSDQSGQERAWRVGEWQSPIWTYRGRLGDSSSAAVFSPDGTRVALARTNDHVLVLDLKDGAPTMDLMGHTNAVAAVDWSPDGTRIATFGEDRTIRLWDAKTGRELCILGRHENPGYDVRFLPNGTLASVDGDGGIKIWVSEPPKDAGKPSQ